MRKILICVFALVVSFMMTSCGYTSVQDSGIDEFSINASSIGLNRGLLPSDTFLSSFEYLNADYHYEDYYSILRAESLERSIVIVEYDADTYKEAKAFCFENMELLDTNKKTYNGYEFVENEDEVNKPYPNRFHMFSYNDERCCLVFIGFYACGRFEDEAKITTNDWGAFLEKYFAEFYDFSE